MGQRLQALSCSSLAARHAIRIATYPTHAARRTSCASVRATRGRIEDQRDYKGTEELGPGDQAVLAARVRATGAPSRDKRRTERLGAEHQAACPASVRVSHAAAS